MKLRLATVSMMVGMVLMVAAVVVAAVAHP